MRTRNGRRWGELPLIAVDHSAVQAWVSELSRRLAPATVAECYRLTNSVFKAACRDRLLGFNPCDGVRLPRRRKKDSDDQVISRADFHDRLLPMCLSDMGTRRGRGGEQGCAGGEVAGLGWDAAPVLPASRRTARHPCSRGGTGSRLAKPYPKSKASRRTVPIPPSPSSSCARTPSTTSLSQAGHIFTNEVGGPLWRGHFRARVWRPALVRAGLLGRVEQLAERDCEELDGGRRDGAVSDVQERTPICFRWSVTPLAAYASTTFATHMRHGWSAPACQ